MADLMDRDSRRTRILAALDGTAADAPVVTLGKSGAKGGAA